MTHYQSAYFSHIAKNILFLKILMIFYFYKWILLFNEEEANWSSDKEFYIVTKDLYLK